MNLYVQKDSALQRDIIQFTDKKVLCIGRPVCNLHCEWCLNKEFFEENSTVIEEEEVYQKIDHEDPKETVIGFGYGEPTEFGDDLLYRICMYAFERGFTTYMTTNGLSGDLEFILEHFTYLDLDIKMTPKYQEKFNKRFSSLFINDYFSRINRFMLRCYSNHKPINISILVIPEIWDDFEGNKQFLDYLLSTLQYGSSITLKSFYSNGTDLSSSFSEDLDILESKIREAYPSLPFGLHKDINYY